MDDRLYGRRDDHGRDDDQDDVGYIVERGDEYRHEEETRYGAAAYGDMEVLGGLVHMYVM